MSDLSDPLKNISVVRLLHVSSRDLADEARRYMSDLHE
ncbi:Uncharacterised protein [Yersinia enterocolitica]|nr:Uncharacterised protein [Yersinia enterocolitica]CRX43909.1 Uncharacterised protein [Yersinia enterocolitica]